MVQRSLCGISLRLIGSLCVLSSPGLAQEKPRGPLAPREEQASLHVADPGLTIELAAAEPEVISPVSIAWDANGFLYVAEMIDYPVAQPSGRIKRLEDRDGDG